MSEKKTFDSSLIYWSAWVVSHRRCQVLSSSCYRPVFARVHRQLWWVMWLHHHSGLVLGSTAVYTARPRYSFTVPSISTRSKKLRQKLSVVGLSVELIWHKCRHDALDIFLSRYIPWRTVGSIAQHHSIRWWSVYRAVSPMTVCSVPERTERLHGRPSVTDMDIRSSTRAITDRRQFIVSAQQKHSNNIWLLQLTPLSSRGAKIAISHKRLDTYRYYVCMPASISQKPDLQTLTDFAACCLRPWLDPSLTAMYFRFCGWCHVFTKSQACASRLLKMTRQGVAPWAKSDAYECLVKEQQRTELLW